MTSSALNPQWEIVIGLETHIQLKTASKIFEDTPTDYGALPNTQASLLSLGMPGTLPVLNEKAVYAAIQFGLSIQAKINTYSIFERKNYFYPDLPKGYQITQNQIPIVGPGTLEITLENGSTKIVNIVRAHLEEDAGKSLHDIFPHFTAIDLNRAGVPLLEIVTAPDLCSAPEAVSYLKTLHALVCYLGICDGNMQEGSFRCDANVSVKPINSTLLGTRAEIKNLNSFRFLEKAIQYEAQRQIALLEAGKTIEQETRLYDPEKNETRALRTKENARDYRYFPDPDLLPLKIKPEFIQEIQSNLPELPWQKTQRFQEQYQLSDYDAKCLTHHKALADYFESIMKNKNISPKLAANWIMGELSAALNAANLEIHQSPISALQLATLLHRIQDNTLSSKMAKMVFEIMWKEQKDVDQIINEQNLKQMDNHQELLAIIDKVISQYPEQLASYRQGKDKLWGFFVGQVMKETQGKANPQQLQELLKQRLQEY